MVWELGVRCCVVFAPENIRPEISALGALDLAAKNRGIRFFTVHYNSDAIAPRSKFLLQAW